MTRRTELHDAVLATASMMGVDLPPAVGAAMALQLARYGTQEALQALARCAREVSGRLTLAAVLDRLESGHPGADEAWAMCPRDDGASVVWTDEIAEAYGPASRLLAEGDAVAARMTFREVYIPAVARARAEARRPTWWASLGHDAAGRVPVLLEAARRGRLPAGKVLDMLPMHAAGAAEAEREVLALGGGQQLFGIPEDLAAVSQVVAMVTRKTGPHG